MKWYHLGDLTTNAILKITRLKNFSFSLSVNDFVNKCRHVALYSGIICSSDINNQFHVSLAFSINSSNLFILQNQIVNFVDVL